MIGDVVPHTVSTARSLSREIALDLDGDADAAMRRIDRAESEAVRRHLLGELVSACAGPASSGDLWPGAAR